MDLNVEFLLGSTRGSLGVAFLHRQWRDSNADREG